MRAQLLLTLPLAGLAFACVREHLASPLLQHAHRRKYAKRADVFPPVLTTEEQILVNSFDNNTISQWSAYYALGEHIAGHNKSQAQWTADRWSENGFTAGLAEYVVFLSYPLSKSLTLTLPDGSTTDFALEEARLEEDITTTYPDRVPTFHGYSFTGNASAEFVYVGRGQKVDFDRLIALGVPLEGKIALAKYGGPFRGLKVKNSQDYGLIGTLIFTDPGDDGNITEANGYLAYPDGPARNPTSVQRGSVAFLSTYPGDPTTPGYPSREDSPRSDRFVNIPHIPSIPISQLDATPLLQALDGHGTSGVEVNRTRWVGALNATYSTGPAPGAVVSMTNVNNETYSPIWNAIGYINGTNADETIIIGNHRDAWIVGGAGDPNSGSAIMIELSKAFGALLETGWKPRRNIVLGSWDGEEYGLIGSTEWVEEYIPWLTETAVTYLNIDVGVSGSVPDLSATPELHTIATEIAKKIIWPVDGVYNQTWYDRWYEFTEGEIGVLGSGSDYTSFLHRGISALDVGAGGSPTDPIWHYHSDYDSYHWMSTFGDPGFLYHKAMGQYLALLAYHMATDEIIPFDVPNFTTELHAYYEELEEVIAGADGDLDTSELHDAIDTFEIAANQVKALETQAVQSGDADLIKVVNHKYRDFSRGFTSQGGLPAREFYRHVITAPGLDTGYAPVTFPGITEATQGGNLTLAAEWVTKTANGILVAAAILAT
ncbi:glutamate carboxypeptidase II [Patellaria atrata CBS 101060]|uniref:Glutamate carboxypeptidase II n=1 Tax=Patellaria atrata CBS 101060 TaxID=1346257 RepID=A0A9P4VK78_9PEZI|nr:glutamate carboxypeptidase II [Patellaria atrata CBS 101060]